MTNDRFSRQALAFGSEGQRRIGESHAAIVGLGGLGSQLAQALAYLGVGRFTLVDNDRVEETNLNRLIGATNVDVGKPKVEVISSRITELNADATIDVIGKDLRSRSAISALPNATVIFGCVDNDGARLILTELCCSYRKLYIDSATEIIPGSGGAPLDFGGRVVVSSPGDFCLFCASELDPEVAKSDLESAEVSELRRAHGYGILGAAAAPSVVTVNGIIANIAATEFMVAVTGLRAPLAKCTYKGMRGVVQVSSDRKKPGCINCDYLLGQGDRADIMRYALD